MKDKANMTSFLQVFSVTSAIKLQAYPVVVEYIPLSLDLGNCTQLAEIETNNSLELEGVLRARWIKPTHLRSQG